jgi:histidinol dehydrogenase
MTAPATTPSDTERRLLRRVDLATLSDADRRAILDRAATAPPELRDRVRQIIDAVRSGGDTALRDANARFGGGLPAGTDGVAPLVVDRAELLRARDDLPADLRAALEHMAANIERFHASQVPVSEHWVDVAPGIRVGRAWRPLERVAAYVPGGSAAYPSSLLMSAIPARLAGVREFAVASPAGPDGRVSPVLLGAAGLMEIDAFHVMGGAQAIAALAYGTETVVPVDKIVGPGNAWVTAAKLEVLGACAIDMPAGPSEVMVVADETADPRHVAADLLSQAEHGPDSPAILVTPSVRLADAVEVEVARQLPRLPRQQQLGASLGSAGLIVVTPTLDAAIGFANDYAPEHLSVVVNDDETAARVIRNAGSLFLGAFAPESAGDYATGSNHVLPTGRLARAYGALGVEAFGRWLQLQRVTAEGLASVRQTVGLVAEAEGLSAHRRAVEVRFE